MTIMESSASHDSDLRFTFPELHPTVEDMFLLEAHQIMELQTRVREADLAALLQEHPAVYRYLWHRCPEVATWLRSLRSQYPPVDGVTLLEAEQTLLWNIADWIVYQRAPELYDMLPIHDWDFSAVTNVVDITAKTVLDAGAGTGRVGFEAAKLADGVFAVEPTTGLRAYMRREALASATTNLFVMDGLLHAVPLAMNHVDVVITCRAIGWHLEEELEEIDRLLAPGGTDVHLTGIPSPADHHDPLHERLMQQGYTADTYFEQATLMCRYWKTRR
ncbi:MAG: class I SAM-dependent methyltransferase [Acidimicrobiales bacterium]